MGEDSKDRRDLGAGPLAPLMARLAAPAIAAQVANLLYSLIDRVLIGHIPGVGAEALAGMGACMPVITLVSSFAVLAAAGGAPLASMELGRGDRAQALLVMAFPHQVAAAFTDDVQTAGLVAGYAPVFFAGFVVFGAQLGMQAVFMGLGKGMCSLAVEAFRKLVVFIPLVFALSGAMGADGVVLAEPISDAASVVFCAVLFAATVPRTLRNGESAR